MLMRRIAGTTIFSSRVRNILYTTQPSGSEAYARVSQNARHSGTSETYEHYKKFVNKCIIHTLEKASMVLTLGCERKKPRTSELLSGKGRRLQAVQVGTQGKAPSVSLPGNCTLGTGKQRSGEA